MDKSSEDARTKLFNHMTNFAAQSHWDHKKLDPLEPSPYLDVHFYKEEDNDQKWFFNPSHKDVLLGFITYNVKGKGAKNKLAKQRIDFINVNVTCYSWLLNGAKWLQAVKDVNCLTSFVAEVEADNEWEKAQRKAAKDKREAEAAKKQEAKQKKDEALKARVLPALEKTMGEFESGDRPASELAELPRSVLVNTLNFYYGAKVNGLSKMDKTKLVQEVMKHFDPSYVAPTAATEGV
jgi:hypothetical protein